jgi:hypothetical protein
VWFAVLLFFAIIGFFGWGAWRDYRGRPIKLWRYYQTHLPEIGQSPDSFQLAEIPATVGEIGYAEFLGLPNGKRTRAFQLWVDLTVCPEAIHLRVSDLLGFNGLPGISIPWNRVSEASIMENEWGTQGFGIHVMGMPPEADPNHVGSFLVWAEVPPNQLQSLSEKVHSLRAT